MLGFIVDFYSRKRLFMGCVLGGSGDGGLDGPLHEFRLAVFESTLYRRIHVGVRIASIAFSLLGDLFSVEERNAASSGLTAMMGMGILVGQVCSGVVGPSWGWPHPFL
jgi:MFS family permease